MFVSIITVFPEQVKNILAEGIFRRTMKRDVVDYNVYDLRDFTEKNYKQVDDYPYGGGTGMVLMPEPIFKAIEKVKSEFPSENGEMRIIYPSPQGELLTQDLSASFSKYKHLVFICGQYKGMDERVLESLVTDEISIGDFVLSGGELPTMVILETIVRLLPGALGDEESARTDSFSDPLLDHPHYTRPEDFRGMKVPKILMSGHHKKISEWRKQQREMRTKTKRPDLWEKYVNQQSN